MSFNDRYTDMLNLKNLKQASRFLGGWWVIMGTNVLPLCIFLPKLEFPNDRTAGHSEKFSPRNSLMLPAATSQKLFPNAQARKQRLYRMQLVTLYY